MNRDKKTSLIEELKRLTELNQKVVNRRGRPRTTSSDIVSYHESTKNAPTSKIENIRRRNLSLIIFLTANGKITDFAQQNNIARVTVSQLMNSRRFTNYYACKIAALIGVEPLIMDIEDESDFIKAVKEVTKDKDTKDDKDVSSEELKKRKRLEKKANGYFIEQLDVFASAGPGTFSSSSNTCSVGDIIYINEQDFIRYLNGKNPSNLKVIKVKGNSMYPLLHDNQNCVVELTSNFSSEGIYVFSYEDVVYIKTLVSNGYSLVAISENKEYDPFVISRPDKFTIHGKLVLTLSYSSTFF